MFWSAAFSAVVKVRSPPIVLEPPVELIFPTKTIDPLALSSIWPRAPDLTGFFPANIAAPALIAI